MLNSAQQNGKKKGSATFIKELKLFKGISFYLGFISGLLYMLYMLL